MITDLTSFLIISCYTKFRFDERGAQCILGEGGPLNYSVIAMSAKFPCVSKRPIVPGIIDLPNFNDKDLEEIFGGGQDSFGVY